MQRNNKVLYQFFHDFVPRLFPERIQGTKFCPSYNLTVINRQILSVPLKLIQITDNIRIELNCFFSQNRF